jgi:hypothetical protein
VLCTSPHQHQHIISQAQTILAAMTIVRSFTLPHYEAFPIHVALFRDVKNASHLRSQLLEANADYDYAFLDAEMVRPNFHVLLVTGAQFPLQFQMFYPISRVLMLFRDQHTLR